MLDVHKLVLLREVALRGSLTAAARSLQVSPSNISQRLSRLEADCGITLLEPEGRGVRLTTAAQQLVAHTEQVLEILERAESELKDVRDSLTGTIRLVAFHTFAIGLLGAVTRHLQAIAPALTIEFTQLDPEAAISELLARRADIAVADEYPGYPLVPSPGLLRSDLGFETIHAYAPRDFLDPQFVSWAMEPRDSDSFRWSLGVCRAAGFEPRVQFESPDPYVHRALLEQGVAGAFLPATAARDLDPKVTTLTHFEAPLHRALVSLVRRGTDRSPAIIACSTAIKLAVGELSPAEFRQAPA
jgi:DNA-binding transcriptional LysR family regulator